MFIRGKKGLTEFKYLVMFDLASKITGVCVWDISAQAPLFTEIIKVTGKHELPVAELYELIDQFFINLYEKRGIKKEDILTSFEAVPCQIRAGKNSTIQTFTTLARAHAVLDLYLYQKNIAVYDPTGLYPITTHCFFKKIQNKEKADTVSKEDIYNYVCEKYNLKDISFDESDAVFLAQTLVFSKWNKDIDEEIKVKKKHFKELKMAHAKEEVQKDIDRLTKIKYYI